MGARYPQKYGPLNDNMSENEARKWLSGNNGLAPHKKASGMASEENVNI